MPFKQSPFPPRAVLYIAFIKYLTSEELTKLNSSLTKAKPRSSINFKKILFESLDPVRLIDSPIHEADPILYNYLMYRVSPGALKPDKFLNEYVTKVGSDNLLQVYKKIPSEVILTLIQ